MKLFTRIAVAVCLTIGIAGAPAGATVIAGSSSAFGESVSLSGLINISSPQQPSASGSAPGTYTQNNNVASLSVPGALSTGIIVVSASSNVDGLAGARTATASATVNNLAVGLTGILSLSATAVGSTATENGEPLASVGSTTITGGSLTVGITTVGIPANPAPNTSIFNAGGISVIVNEQILGVGSIQVNAIHISLSVTGTSGNIYISHSQAALTSVVPEPSTALLLGLGLAGFATRRR